MSQHRFYKRQSANIWKRNQLKHGNTDLYQNIFLETKYFSFYHFWTWIIHFNADIAMSQNVSASSQSLIIFTGDTFFKCTNRYCIYSKFLTICCFLKDLMSNMRRRWKEQDKLCPACFYRERNVKIYYPYFKKNSSFISDSVIFLKLKESLAIEHVNNNS